MNTRAAGAAARHAERAFGFWLWLMTDAVVFALLFATYAVLVDGTAGGPTGRELFDLPSAFVGTLLLLFSSATFGFATLATRRGDRAATLRLLVLTGALGAGFLALEVRELAGLVARGAGPDRSGFLSAFFTLVGAHGLHVLAGLLGLAVMAAQIGARGLTLPVRSRMERLGMFWHFLDIVWIGVFSFVYLAGAVR